MGTVYLRWSDYKFWYKTNPRKLCAVINEYNYIERLKNPFAEKTDKEGKKTIQKESVYVDQVFF